jgi:hypothetical protein
MKEKSENTKSRKVAQKDVYKPEWTKNDTILTWYCTKFIKEGDTRKLGLKDLTEVANQIIGSTEFSLTQQMSNMRYLMGDTTALNCYSKIQEEVYNDHRDTTEEVLREMCLDIINNTPKSVYDVFIEKFNKNQGIEAECKKIKTEAECKKIKTEAEKQAIFKKESENKLAAEFKRKGLDMSRFKSAGIRQV